MVLQHGKDRIPPRVGGMMSRVDEYRMLHAVAETECCRAAETRWWKDRTMKSSGRHKVIQ
jgi:hypothetical protein